MNHAIKIMDLNMWNYNDFDKRKKSIIQFIKKHKPEVITFQEVRDDSRRNKIGDNQLRQLNKQVHYKYSKFFETGDVNKINRILNDPKYDPSNPRVREGLGILSKYKIIKYKGFKLGQHPKDKYTRGMLWVRLNTEPRFELMNVHFSNRDLFSALHLKETLRIIRENKLNPIILGDFNIRKKNVLYKTASEEYVISLKKFKYVSYPAKNETLDYILIPKSYKFKSFRCIGRGLSDHRALIAEIIVK